MLGLSNSQLLLTVGFIAAVTGPKDLQKFARLGGFFLGRATGYIQMARGHLNGVMQQTQMQEISKEINDLRAKMDVISHGANFSLFPTPLTRRVETDSPESTPTTNENNSPPVKVEEKQKVADHWTKAQEFSGSSASVNLHAQATAFSRLSETVRGENLSLSSDQSLPPVLPVSAEMANFLPQRKESARGSDIMLEAVLEAEVAHSAKDLFSQAGEQTLSVKDESAQKVPTP